MSDLDKHCVGCHSVMAARPGESPSTFAARKYCCSGCMRKHQRLNRMNRPNSLTRWPLS